MGAGLSGESCEIMKSKNILQTADTLTSTTRQEEYGNPAEVYGTVAGLWSAAFGREFTAKDVVMGLLLMKVGREVHKHKLDNLVDICGYGRLLEMLEE